MHWEVWRDLTASSAANFPITSASLRLVVMWIGDGSTRCTYSGARVPLRFTFTTNLMFFMFSPLSPNCSGGGRSSSTDNKLQLDAFVRLVRKFIQSRLFAVRLIWRLGHRWLFGVRLIWGPRGRW